MAHRVRPSRPNPGSLNRSVRWLPEMVTATTHILQNGSSPARARFWRAWLEPLIFSRERKGGKRMNIIESEPQEHRETKTDRKPEVVVITGASAGVGRATVRRFAKDGACIGLLARGIDGLEGAKQEVEAAGGRALVVPIDVADSKQVEAAAEAVEREFGPIDVWINDAMTSVFAPVKEMTPEEFRRVTEVTYLGVVYGTMAALKRMLPRDRGTIVQVGSALAYRSIPLQSAYCGAKH